jgi:lysophospholipase L1-like esterase
MRLAARTAIAAGLATLCVGALAGPASAAPAPVTPGSGYLALGDSVTFGYEEPQVVPAPNYHDAASFLGYPEHLARALHLKLANGACPGETSASLINASAPSNGCADSPNAANPAYRKQFPLHVHYKGSQLAFAVRYLRTHKNVRLVSLMIGANDGFLCRETTSDGCASELKSVLAKSSKNVATILSAVRNQAGYRGQLVLLNYYSLDYGSLALNAQSLLINHAQDAPAKKFHAAIADGFGELRAATLHYGGNTCTANLLNIVAPGRCGVHPSYAGQAVLAQALAKAVRF